MDWLYDDRTDCWSVLTSMNVREYLKLVKGAHADRGGISGQREVLKTTTAKRIRDRMVADVRGGAVLPPVVVGIVVDDKTFKRFPNQNIKNVSSLVKPEALGSLAIIDGMQRTAALIEAAEIDKAVLEKQVRVELWLAQYVRSMVYRMLVLNTGQVPWTLARQLSVIYEPLLLEIRESVPAIDEIFSPDKKGRRSAPAQYGSDAIVELYIAFSLRKTTVDTKEALSEEFSRLDFVENVSDLAFQSQFYGALSLMTEFDKAFSRASPGPTDRFSKGHSIFAGQPARIGFVVAVAQHVLGRPGMDRRATDRKTRMNELTVNARKLLKRLSSMTERQLNDFMKIDVLAETLDRRVGQVGRYERSVYFEAFKVLIDEEFQLPSMEACWRAN